MPPCRQMQEEGGNCCSTSAASTSPPNCLPSSIPLQRITPPLEPMPADMISGEEVGSAPTCLPPFMLAIKRWHQKESGA